MGLFNSDISTLILRVSVGGIMAFQHGLPKFQSYAKLSQQFPDPLGVGSPLSLALVIFAELLCALLIVLGIGVRFVAIPLIITMGVAAFIVHADDPFSRKEMAILYLSVFIALFSSGAGHYKLSIQQLLPKKKWIEWGLK